MKTRVWIALWVWFALGVMAWAARGDAIDEYVQQEMKAEHIPGVVVSIVRAEGSASRAYGLANVELNAAATEKTVFQIQSITKTFTSAAILVLAEEGKLSIDDLVSKHLEGTPESWKQITLKHLLSHTSGIKDFINEPTASLRLDVSEEDVFKATVGRPLNFGPGEKYAYSNTNYHLLAMVIRKITGKGYGEFLEERFFRPLGMTGTRVQSLSEIVPGRASGYLWEGGKLRNGQFIAEPILAYGGGGILSTGPDMAKWAAAVMSGKVVKKESLEMAWTPPKLKGDAKTNYGLGWAVGAVNGHRVVEHSGAHATGFTSDLVCYPGDSVAVIVLTNSRNANPSKIAQHVAGMVEPELERKK